ncbi:MAG: hypothetical protein DMF60_11390 [Acidobacteria bacterium]|nr:MAG: hypothetical protein DMF60_11390 [Acidobacteriota bacterium]
MDETASLEGLRVRLLPDRERERTEAIGRVVKAFREKLTPQQNARWSDNDIIKAFIKIDDSPTFLDGLDAKQKMLGASSRDLSQQQDFFRAMGESAKLCSALYSHAVKFWDVILKYERLEVGQGKYLQNADRGCGLLETGGYGEEKLEEIAGHERANEDGHKQRGEFVLGSGGLRVGVHGKEESIAPIFNVGSGPDSDEPDAEIEARRIREQWLDENEID